MRKCARDSNIVSDSLAKKLLDKDHQYFWKEMKKMNNSRSTSLATNVDIATGNKDINNM